MEHKYTNGKSYCEVDNHCHYTGKFRGAAFSICNLKYSIPKEIPMVFQNGSNYYYHFIIKELAKVFEGQFNWQGENAEKCNIFSVPITSEAKRIDKNGEEITKTTSYILQFIDSTRFMRKSLSNHVDNLTEVVRNIKCKYGRHDNKKHKAYRIKYKDCA